VQGFFFLTYLFFSRAGWDHNPRRSVTETEKRKEAEEEAGCMHESVRGQRKTRIISNNQGRGIEKAKEPR